MSIRKNFLVSVLGTGLSRVLGFARDVVITRYLGASDAHDAYQQAFAIPGMFRRFVADEGLTGALIPAIAKAETEDGTPAAQALADQVFSALLLVNAVLIALVMAIPEPFTWLVASGFADEPEKFALTVQMTRWLMPFVGMVSLVSFYEGLLNHRGHFFVPKMAPGIVSAAVAAAVVLLGSSFEEPAWALVVGYAAGGLVHVVVHLPFVWRRWGPVRLVRQIRSPRSSRLFRELGKVVAIGLFAQINILVLRTLTSWLPPGSAVHYAMSTRMIDFTQGIIAVALGSALLPAIAARVSAEEWDDFGRELRGALRLAAFLLCPAAVGLFVYAVPLVAVLFLNERFRFSDVVWTARTIQVLTPFMLSLAAVGLLKRVFNALDDRNVILVIGALGVALTGVSGLLFLDLGVVGLGLALSVTTTVQAVLYAGVLLWRLRGRFTFGGLGVPLIQITLACVPMGLFAYRWVLPADWSRGATWPNLVTFVSGIAGSMLVYAVAAWLLNVRELTMVTDRLRARFRR
jgi:putative peptidoglycan lipid II flippase